MREYQVALLPGDGIGHEVCPEGVKVIAAVGELLGNFRITYETFPWGCEYYLRHGEMMAKDALRILEPFDAIYFGAVGFPSVPDHISLHGLLLPVRQGFEQYANVRPSLLLPGVPGPLKDKQSGDIDFVVVRENTEGEYAARAGGSTTACRWSWPSKRPSSPARGWNGSCATPASLRWDAPANGWPV